MTTKRFLAAVVLIGLSTGIVLAQSTNPLVGTWKLNVEKSKAPFKSGATTIEAVGEGIKFMVDLVGADGTKNHWEFTANFDGKDAPVKGENPYGDTVALTRVDARTIRIVNKYPGETDDDSYDRRFCGRQDADDDCQGARQDREADRRGVVLREAVRPARCRHADYPLPGA